MNQSVLIGALLAGSYLLGSLPFGLWVAKRWKGVDIRTVGSGNIGSTNVGRVCGPKAGAAVFTLDVIKGLVPPLVASALNLGSQWQILAGLCALLGHNYSIWLGFKGGKGIATSVGALLGIAPRVVPVGLTLFLIEMALFQWVSLGSILSAAILPFSTYFLYPGDWYRFAFGCAAGVMAIYKHRANIQRLLAGTEPKVKVPWKKQPPLVTNTPPASEANARAVVLQDSEKDTSANAPR